jgi:hypothetical protein
MVANFFDVDRPDPTKRFRAFKKSNHFAATLLPLTSLNG